ncbi:hypothetical protein Ae168Ps1_1288c [Pseudonocardia sp. Ae168_Ps1]|nr:hypothetical protein Ae150APs1_1285c [Pseudonocardia sp. Ae150A_Ps1]OLL78882.1 hypothetical protein Ae168Ps1_1288c [Pseudonocardia sp. Ae168_Ps1]OLL86979.1 hypothetical protein Ae263Ps1_4034 [Pseudonocardia sp. Ae263_Ps1]OLL92977.1 hypothetical protein Ae356Ps1_2874c [Pseudonocardia sp. Ae356_Ps1]
MGGAFLRGIPAGVTVAREPSLPGYRPGTML